MKVFMKKVFSLAICFMTLLFAGCGPSSSKVYTASGNIDNHDYVDLGLSVKWATMNVGATKPEEYGNYFAWGETTTKTTYNWSTYKHCKGRSTFLTKYNTSILHGIDDYKKKLELIDDAAHANWGGCWRMPTDAEWTELRKNCTWKWTTKQGVKGYKVTSKQNGNSIFLPAAGGYGDDSRGDVGYCGCYWSTLAGTGSLVGSAWFVCFESSYVERNSIRRDWGLSVRPVCP